MNITLPEVIFFDWDGTLADSYKFLEGAHNHIRRELGLSPFVGDEFKGYFGHPREKLYAELYGQEIEKAKELFGTYVRENHVKHLKPMPGAADLLEACEGLGIAMGIISNKKAEFLKLEIETFGWQGYFKSVMGAGDAGEDKPSAAPLIKSAGILKRNSMENIWYMGDTDVDLQCAKNAGCASVFLMHDSLSEKWEKLYKPFLIFKNLPEMTEFLLQCDENQIKSRVD
jgi:phosphoglycolate phosphatase